MDTGKTHISRSRSRPVDKAFRVFAPDQGSLLPPLLDDWLPAERLARFIAVLVDEHLDPLRIRAAYTEGRGAQRCSWSCTTEGLR